MKIIKGKHKGKKFTINQFCNNWFTVKEAALVFSPTMVELNTEEMMRVIKATANKDIGIMFGVYKLLASGKFKKIRKEILK